MQVLLRRVQVLLAGQPPPVGNIEGVPGLLRP